MRTRSIFLAISLYLLILASNTYAQFGSPVPKYPMEMDGFVNVLNNLSTHFSSPDIAVPGRGLGLSFTRYYNSRKLRDFSWIPSYLGSYRFSHNYQWRVESLSSHGRRRGPFYRFTTGRGATYLFKKIPPQSPDANARFEPEDGVRASLSETPGSDEIPSVITLTTKHGIHYQFESYNNKPDLYYYVLKKIKDPNGNHITLHYEIIPTTIRPRLVAVTDTVGRILKFYYELTSTDFRPYDSPYGYRRFITKIEFGRGTPQALTTVYQTVRFKYTRISSDVGYAYQLTSVHHDLGTGDPRGTELVTRYEWTISGWVPHLSAVVSPNGRRTEFASFAIRVKNGTPLTLQHLRKYEPITQYSRMYVHAHDTNDQPRWQAPKQNHYQYDIHNGRVNSITLRSWLPPPRRYTHPDASLATFGWSYDTHGNIIESTCGGSSSIQYTWYYKIYYEGANPDHNKQMGNPTKWEQRTFPIHGTLLRKWEADYETTYNKPVWQIDPMGHKTEFTYDTKGNLTQTKSKASTGTQAHAITHDIITTHQYDTYGNRIKTTFMPGTTQQKIVQTIYDSTYHTYPIEVRTTVTVNGASRTIRTRSEWDVNRGLKTASIDAMGRRTEYAYWKDGLLKYTRRVADNMYTIPTYDKAGNVTMTQVRQNNWQTGTLIAQTKTEYDGMGRPKKVHSFSNNNWSTPYATTESTYDIFGNLTQSKDPRGLITTYQHGHHGQVTKQTLPDGDWIETRYNKINQVTKAWTSQTGSETAPAISHTYDNLNRPLTTTYSTGETVSFTYDLADNPLTMTTNDGSTTYTYTNTYDQLNRLITRTDSLLNKKTLYEYNDTGTRKRLHIQPSTGGSDLYDVTYTYDEANRLLSVRDVLSNKTASYEYFDNGALKTTTLPNGITAHRTLDTLNRLDTLQYKKTATAVLASLDYNYDVKSNVTQLIRNDTGAGGSRKTFRFAYDGISRLTSANYGNETVTYAYDKVGNRKTMTSSTQGTTTYTIATNSNQLTYRSLVPEDTAFSTMSYTYDAEGKLTSRAEGTDSDAFTYGFGSQLKQIQKTRAGSVTQTISYAYDGAGQRVKVTDSGGTRYFLYDGGMPLLELNATKQITASYLYGADGVVYRKKHTSTPSYEYHLTNALGSTIIETNNSKTVLARYEYDAFGAVRSETGTSDNVRKFTGKEYDADVKLYYYSARYYDPYIGRFTQRDPIGEGVNWYAYVANNPLKFIDPTGTRIVILGPVDQNGNSTSEVTISSEGTDFHGGSVNTLSPEASQFYEAISGRPTVTTADGIVTRNPALAKTASAGSTIKDVINSDKTVYVSFDSALKTQGETDFTSATSDDHIMIRINGEYANRNFGDYLRTRVVLVHELVHAAQAIADPTGFRNRSYYNVYKLEFEAYTRTARFAAELQGHYVRTIPYMPASYLASPRFNANSLTFRAFVHMAAQASAARFR